MKLYKEESKKNDIIIYKPDEFKERIKDVKNEIKTTIGTIFVSGSCLIYSLTGIGFEIANKTDSNLMILDSVAAGVTTAITITALMHLKQCLNEKKKIKKEEQDIIEEFKRSW